MLEANRLSESKQALLKKYLQGEYPDTVSPTNNIERHKPKDATPSPLLARPITGQLVRVLEKQGDRGDTPLLTAVQNKGNKRPFFFLHGDYLTGASYCYPLAHGLGLDQPFYTLDTYDFEQLQILPTFEEIVNTYIAQLRAAQPKGPYLLGGFCNGAVIAYGMARQLYKDGDTVDLLVMIDPSNVTYLHNFHRSIHHIGNVIGLNQQKQVYWFHWRNHLLRYIQHIYSHLSNPAYSKLQAQIDREQLKQNDSMLITLHKLYILQVVSATNSAEISGKQNSKTHISLPRLTALFPDPIFPAIEALCKDWESSFYWTSSDYVPGSYPGKSTFFFTQTAQASRDASKWLKIARARDREVEVHFIAGTHDTCKTTHIHDFIEHLRGCLKKSQATDSYSKYE